MTPQRRFIKVTGLNATLSPSDREVLELFENKRFSVSSSFDRQVEAHVRDLIVQKKLAVHTRIPPLRTLAKVWGTNLSTVQNAFSRLASEGLIVQSPKRGTFVAAPRRALRRLCLYHHGESVAGLERSFYSYLNDRLYRILTAQGVEIVSYFDHRPYEKMHLAPSEIRNLARDGAIDAVIATQIHYHHAGWLRKLEVPVTSLMLDPPYGAYIDYRRMARLVVAEAIQKKKKTIALLMPPILPRPGEESLRDLLEAESKAHGLSFLYLGDSDLHAKVHDERYAYITVEALLKKKIRSCLLFVFPDALVGGVLHALLYHRISVPDQLALVSHRNAETRIYSPVPMTWLTVKVDDFAQGLLKQIRLQIEGRKFEPVTVPVRREESAQFLDR